jgi:hypothetical protein
MTGKARRYDPCATIMESRLPGTIPRGKGDATMKFMIIVKASNNSEAEVVPSEELLTALGKYN